MDPGIDAMLREAIAVLLVGLLAYRITVGLIHRAARGEPDALFHDIAQQSSWVLAAVFAVGVACGLLSDSALYRLHLWSQPRWMINALYLVSWSAAILFPFLLLSYVLRIRWAVAVAYILLQHFLAFFAFIILFTLINGFVDLLRPMATPFLNRHFPDWWRPLW
jgi:hypothetical protein